MSSSIFNFEHFRRYRALPVSERRWQAVIAVVFVALFAICYALPVLLFGPSGCRDGTVGTAAVASLSRRTEVLFLGSSHFLFGIRPERYSVPAVNLSATWLDYFCGRRVLEKNISRAPNVKIVVIEYDELPLVADLMASLLAGGDLRPLTDLGLTPREIPVERRFDTLRAIYVTVAFPLTVLPRLTPLGWAGRGNVCGRLQHPTKGFAPGYVYTEDVTSPTFDIDNVFNALAIAARNERVVQRNLAALEATIAPLRRHGVRVVLLRMPHRARYVRGCPAIVRTRWEELRRRMIARSKIDHGVTILDWSQRPEFDDHDYFDDHHLNVFGANKLATLLDTELRYAR